MSEPGKHKKLAFTLTIAVEAVVLLALACLLTGKMFSTDAPTPDDVPQLPPTQGDAMNATSAPPAEKNLSKVHSLMEAALPELESPAILIEKSKKRLTVFDGGRPVKIYSAAIGGNSADKCREGDRATPEGEFYVCVKNPVSKYVLSLGLSYPNREDAERGLRDGLITQSDFNEIIYALRRKTQPPWNTPLGGEIMIHGCRNGGRGTLGCIALEDDDIRELYPNIPLGVRVVIMP